MGLAPYFAKTVQSASQVLADFDEASFTAALDARLVGIAWDGAAATSAEGSATLELLTDLLARLYPRLALVALDERANGIRTELDLAASAINPNLEIIDTVDAADVVVVVGATALPNGAGPRRDSQAARAARQVFYVGSDGWVLRFSRNSPVGSGSTDLVFAAGAAACVAAGNVFRAVFGAHLATSELDNDFALSLLSMEREEFNVPLPTAVGVNANPGVSGPLDVGEVHLVGVGAIGHGAVWAWRRTPRLRGTIHLVDGEHYDDTNPQRYVETKWDVSGPKATGAARAWTSPDVVVVPHDVHWDAYIAREGPHRAWRIERAALALDTADARIAVQASIPRAIHNAWTRPENLGISRHDFLTGACVACLYVPRGRRPNRDEIVARAFHMTAEIDLRRVRLYLDTGAPLDLAAIDWLANSLGLDVAARRRAAQFVGAPLLVFYTRGLCGGAVMPLSDMGGRVHAVEVPLAFQSTLAGVLLAADVVMEACALRSRQLPARTEVNLLAPMGRVLNSPQERPSSGACLCQDAEFVSAYREKYGLADSAR